MADSKAPQGVAVPSKAAIDIMNQNAATAAKRSTYASLVTSQYATNRDSLRRDYAVRTPTEQVPGFQDVPKDSIPTNPDGGVTGLIGDLVKQFKGTGGDGGAYGRGSGGGGRGFGSSGGSGGPPVLDGGGSSNPGEVQTFKNPDAKPGEVIRSASAPAKETRVTMFGDPNPGRGWTLKEHHKTGEGLGQWYNVWEKN